MSIKSKLRIRMAEKNMSQKELSLQTGIRPNTLGAYMNDTYKQISKKHLNIFCKLFNCKIEDIIEYIPDN